MRPVLLVPERAAVVDQLALLRSLSLRDGFLARLRHRWWVLDRVAFALLGWLCHPLGGGGY